MLEVIKLRKEKETEKSTKGLEYEYTNREELKDAMKKDITYLSKCQIIFKENNGYKSTVIANKLRILFYGLKLLKNPKEVFDTVSCLGYRTAKDKATFKLFESMMKLIVDVRINDSGYMLKSLVHNFTDK